MRKKGIMAMEGLELPTDPEVSAPEATDTPPAERSPEELEAERIEGEVEQATAFVEAPEVELLAADDADGQLEAADASIDEACDTADTLDQLEVAVQDSIEEGGLSREPAEAIRAAVEHMRTRLCFPASSRPVFPAMEGFSDRAHRIGATKYALEGLQKTNRKVKDAILTALAQAFEWLKKFYQYITEAAARLQPRAEELEKAASSIAGKSAPANAKVSAAGFGKALNIAGKVPEGSAFTSEFIKYLKEAELLSKTQRELAANGGKALTDLIHATDDAEKFNAAAEELGKVIADSAQGERSANKDLGGEGLEVWELKLGFANKSFYSIVGSGGNIGKSQFLVADTTGAKEIGELGEVAPLNPKDIVAIAKAAGAHLEGYRGFNDEIRIVDRALKDLASAIKGENGDGGFSHQYTGIARSYIGALTKGAKSLRSYDVTIVKAALDYSASSLQAIKKASQSELASGAPAAA